MRRSLALLVFLACGGCVAPSPVVRLPAPASVEVAYLLDDPARRVTQRLEPGTAQLFDQILAERNLRPHRVEASDTFELLTSARSTDRRLRALREAAGPSDFVLLVEAQAVFYSQINGRYRWTVSAKLSMAGPGQSAPQIDELETPALLLFDHEREQRAVQDVAAVLSRRLAYLVDGYLHGLTDARPAKKE